MPGAVLVPGTGPDMPVILPAADSLVGSIIRAAAITRQRKTPPRATSVTLPGPLFRLLASTGLPRRLVNRQRLVHSPATNLRGLVQPPTFAGAPLRAVIPSRTPPAISPSPTPRCPTPGHFGSLCCPTGPRHRTRKC